MAKLFFILNNHNDVNEGYRQVSAEYARNYKNNPPHGDKVYFINLGYAFMEVDRKNRREYRKSCNHSDYVNRMNGEYDRVPFDAIMEEDFILSDMIPDDSEPLENVVIQKIMIEQMPEMLIMLNDEERVLINSLFFDDKSENELSKELGVSQSTVSRKKKKALRKLKALYAR